MQPSNQPESAHFYAAIIVLIDGVMSSHSVIERICEFSILEKYGFCLAVVVVLHGFGQRLTNIWTWARRYSEGPSRPKRVT